MKNQRGITTIEVIICFVLVMMVTVSMYSTISSFNEKRILENAKQDMHTYKNIITKLIQDDFIRVGLTRATYHKTEDASREIHTLDCELRDGTKRRLIIRKQNVYAARSESVNEYYMISYGNPESDDVIDYPLPDLGSYEEDGVIKYDFSIEDVEIQIDGNNVLRIYVGFHYPDLDNQLSMLIVCPINFVASTSDGTNKWDY